MTTIGQRVRLAREQLGMTQEELSVKAGYANRFAISKIERGASDVTREKVVALAKALAVSPMYLMGIDNPEEQAKIDAQILLDPELKEMIVQYLLLTPENQKLIRDNVKALSRSK